MNTGILGASFLGGVFLEVALLGVAAFLGVTAFLGGVGYIGHGVQLGTFWAWHSRDYHDWKVSNRNGIAKSPLQIIKRESNCSPSSMLLYSYPATRGI